MYFKSLVNQDLAQGSWIDSEKCQYLENLISTFLTWYLLTKPAVQKHGSCLTNNHLESQQTFKHWYYYFDLHGSQSLVLYHMCWAVPWQPVISLFKDCQRVWQKKQTWLIGSSLKQAFFGCATHTAGCSLMLVFRPTQKQFEMRITCWKHAYLIKSYTRGDSEYPYNLSQ